VPVVHSLTDLDADDDGEMVVGETEALGDIGGDARGNVEGDTAGTMGKSRSSTPAAD
jgi:hypothetical protein